MLAELGAASVAPAAWQPAGDLGAAVGLTVASGLGLLAAYAAYIQQEAGGLGVLLLGLPRRAYFESCCSFNARAFP